MKRLFLVLVVSAVLLVLPAVAIAADPLDIVSLASSAQPNVNGWSNESSITFTWAVADPNAAAGYSFLLSRDSIQQPDEAIDGSTTAQTYPGGPGADLDYGVSGDLFFTVKACDADGNWGAPQTIEVLNDQYAPQIDGLSFNGDWDPNATDLPLYFNVPVTVDWGVQNPDPPELSGIWKEELSVDGGQFNANTVIPAPSDHSNDGSHVATLRVTDLAGNANQKSRPLVIDTVSPTTTLSPGDGLWHRASDYVLSANDALSGVLYTVFLIDNQGTGITDVSDGQHTTTYWSADRAGNKEAPHNGTIKIDNTPPDSIVAGNDSDWHSAPVKLTFGAADAFSGVDHLESRLDGGAWATGASRTVPAKADHSVDGIHTVDYRAGDKAGNVEDPNSVDVRIDTTSPATTLSGADGAWHNKDVKLSLNASDAGSGVAETDCRIDGGDWVAGDAAAVSAPSSHAGDGVHTVGYRSTDQAGNVETEKTAQVTIDTTPPVTSDSSDSSWHRPGYVLTLTPTDAASGVAGTQYRVDGAAWQAGATALIAKDGVHTVDYRSTDAAGNVEAARSCQVMVDGTAPVTTQTGADDPWHHAPVKVSLKATDATSGVAKSEFKVDDGVWTTGGSVTITTNGDHIVSYRSTDNAGNVETAQTCHVKIDTKAPATTQSGADARWHNGDVAITFDASDAGSGVARTSYSTDGGTTWTPDSVPLVVEALPDHSNDGSNVVLFRSVDNAGNLEAPQSCTVRIDTVQPTTEALKSATVRRGFWATLRYRVDDPLPNGHAAKVTIKVSRLSGKLVKTLSIGLRPVNRSFGYLFHCNLAKRTYRFSVYATDVAGNRQTLVGSNRLVVR